MTVINFWRWPLCPWTSKYKVQLRNNEKHGAVTQTVKKFRDVIYINQTLNLFWSLGLSGHYLFTLINFKLLIVLFNLCLLCLQWHLISRNTIKSFRLRKIIFFCAFQKKFRHFKICNDYFGLAKLARELFVFMSCSKLSFTNTFILVIVSTNWFPRIKVL